MADLRARVHEEEKHEEKERHNHPVYNGIPYKFVVSTFYYYNLFNVMYNVSIRTMW